MIRLIPERLVAPLERIEIGAQSLLLLAMRLYIVWVFFRSGLTKIQSWDTTLTLFEYEYAVPLLSPTVAAWLATFGELAFPALLSVGLFTRFVALGLFVLNVVAATSYPDLSPAGLNDHYFWGAMLATLAVFGGGRLAVDAWLFRRST